MAKPANSATLDTGHALYTSLTAAFLMAENTGTSIVDKTGNGHTATTGTGVTWTTDANGDVCLASDGTNAGQAVAIASPIVFNGSASWSFAFRAKQTSADVNGMFAGNENTAGLGSFLWLLNGTTLKFRTGGAVDYDFTITSAIIEANYLVVYDQPGAKLHCYQNGSEIGTGLSVSLNIADITFRSLMSGYDGSGSLDLVGKMSYGYVWSGRALNSTDASTLHSNPYVLFTAGNTDYSLNVAAGSYAVTGVDAGFRTDRSLNADIGTYAVTGLGTTFGRAMNAGAGAYSVDGADATLHSNIATAYTLNAGAGSYVVTGVDFSNINELGLNVAPGSYAVTGAAVAFRRAFPFNASAGTYTVSGRSVHLQAPGDPASSDTNNHALTGLSGLSGGFTVGRGRL